MKTVNELAPIGKLRGMDRKNLVSYLTSLGYKQLGYGVNGYVLKHPKQDYVIKVFRKDHCYIQFIKLAVENRSNPHFPKFIGKPLHVPWDDQLFGIRMEELKPYRFGDDNVDKALEYAEAYIGGWELNSAQWKKIDRHLGLLFTEALRLVRPLAEYCSPDLHADNVMWRGSTLVIIDPVGPP